MFNYLIDTSFTYLIKLAAKIDFFCIQSIPYGIFFQQNEMGIVNKRQQAIVRGLSILLPIPYCL